MISDTSDASNLDIELIHAGQTMQAHGNHIFIGQHAFNDDAWRLRVRRRTDPNDLHPNPGRYSVSVTYTSVLPVLERRIPVPFFENGFNDNWNDQRYVWGWVEGTKVVIEFDPLLAGLYDLTRQVIETGVELAKARNIHTTSVKMHVGAGPSPAPRGGNTVFFSVRVDCAADGKIELPLLDDVELPAFYVTVRFYLWALGDLLYYLPRVESNLLDAIAHVDNAKEAAEKAINEFLYKAQMKPDSGFSAFGEFLTPWLIGENRELISIDYEPGPGDTLSPNGITEPATGTLVIRYVGARPTPRNDPFIPLEDDPAPVVDDGSIRLFDVPDEEPDPLPDGGPLGGGPFGPRRPRRPRVDVGPLAKIDHIVVLMMENRSFDQMLGHLSRDGDRGDVNGLNKLPAGDPNNPQHNRYNNRNYFPRQAPQTAWPGGYDAPGPCHESHCVHSQMQGGMGGFVSDWAARVGDNPDHLQVIFDYFTAEQVPVYSKLAEHFAISDAWFTSHAGPTWPNRFVLLTGDLNVDRFGRVEMDNPHMKTMVPAQGLTIMDHLDAAGASWKVFEHGYSFIRLFGRHTYNIENVVPFDDPVRGFEAAARSGNLPNFSLLEPDYVDLPPGNDDHPPADVADGQALVNRIVRALFDSPAWERTMLVITYDEHGGFYDHVQPPADAVPLQETYGTLGPRVPAFVVSAYTKPRSVLEGRYDHTSIGATVLRRFCRQGVPSMSPRLDAALDLRGALTLDQPRPRPNPDEIDLPPVTPPSARAAADARARSVPVAPSKQPNEDFHWVLSVARLITGSPPG